MSGASLRLFVAVELPNATREGLRRLVDELRHQVAERACRWVRPEGLHVTLKFLGDVPRARVADIEAALRRATSDHQPLRLQPAGLGRFGGRRGLRVVWVGVEGDVARAAALAADIDLALAPVGFAPETRPFAAHLTLGRVRDRAARTERAQLAHVLDVAPQPDLPGFTADEIVLMRSTLLPGGARHEALARIPLGG